LITSISLHNFKSWKELRDLPLAPLTVLFGTNSSGKTSLLAALLMLKQTAASYDRKRAVQFGGTEKDLVDLGSFADLVFGHDTASEIGLTLKWTLADPASLGLPPGEPEKHAQELQYDVAWQLEGDDVVVARLKYQADGVCYGLTRTCDGQYDQTIEGMRRRVGRPWPLSVAPDSCYGIPRQAARDVTDIDLLEFNHQFELLMGSIYYLGPLREYPRRFYPWTGEAPQAIDPRGRGAIEAMLAAERLRPNVSRKAKKPSLADLVQSWLRRFGLAERMGITPTDKAKRVYEVRVKTRRSAADVTVTDVGFGVSQVLPVVVQLLFVPEHSIVVLEQPEIHLHPSVQADLADLLLEVGAARKLQILVESHSEHFLRRLQRRIAEGEQPLASPDNVRLHFCSLGEAGSTAQHVQADIFGRIENWPAGFFGDIEGDLDAMTIAAMGRRRGKPTAGH
jgi:predicted ATPase